MSEKELSDLKIALSAELSKISSAIERLDEKISELHSRQTSNDSSHAIVKEDVIRQDHRISYLEKSKEKQDRFIYFLATSSLLLIIKSVFDLVVI